MTNKKLKYEDAVRIIRQDVARAESGFQKENGRFPSLVNEQDYVLLTNHLDIGELCESYGRAKEAEGGGQIIPVHDVAFVLMRNHLEREEFFRDLGKQRKDAFDGFVGVLDYHPPEREYRIRIDALNRLRQTSEEFPKDFAEFVRHIKDIYKTCFLKQLKETNPSGGKTAYENIGTCVVNPSAHLHLWLKCEESNFEGLLKVWEEYAQTAKRYAKSRTYN